MRLRVSGMTFDEIAEELGYANRSGAYKAYQRGMRRLGLEDLPALIAMQYERYNAMLLAAWAGVQAGDVEAIDQALVVMNRIDRLYGADLVGKSHCRCGP